jgi:hypothetical protein
LDTPILTSEGKLTKKSRLIASSIQGQIAGPKNLPVKEDNAADSEEQIEADDD